MVVRPIEALVALCGLADDAIPQVGHELLGIVEIGHGVHGVLVQGQDDHTGRMVVLQIDQVPVILHVEVVAVDAQVVYFQTRAVLQDAGVEMSPGARGSVDDNVGVDAPGKQVVPDAKVARPRSPYSTGGEAVQQERPQKNEDGEEEKGKEEFAHA